MKRISVLTFSTCLLTVFQLMLAQDRVTAELESHKVGLPNGWTLSPVGKQIELGDLPLNLVISHDKNLRQLLITDKVHRL